MRIINVRAGVNLHFVAELYCFLSQGRNPFFLEPSVIITITDGNKLTHSSGVSDEVRIQTNTAVMPCNLAMQLDR